MWKKNSCRGAHLKKNSCTSNKRKKKFVQVENSPRPPHHFSNGPSLSATPFIFLAILAVFDFSFDKHHNCSKSNFSCRENVSSQEPISGRASARLHCDLWFLPPFSQSEGERLVGERTCCRLFLGCHATQKNGCDGDCTRNLPSKAKKIIMPEVLIGNLNGYHACFKILRFLGSVPVILREFRRLWKSKFLIQTLEGRTLSPGARLCPLRKTAYQW